VFYTGFGLTFVISEPYLANCIAIQLHLIIDLVALKITFFLRQTRFFIAEFKYNIIYLRSTNPELFYSILLSILFSYYLAIFISCFVYYLHNCPDVTLFPRLNDSDNFFPRLNDSYNFFTPLNDSDNFFPPLNDSDDFIPPLNDSDDFIPNTNDFTLFPNTNDFTLLSGRNHSGHFSGLSFNQSGIGTSSGGGGGNNPPTMEGPKNILPDAFTSAIAKIDARLANPELNIRNNIFDSTGHINQDFIPIEKDAILGSRNYSYSHGRSQGFRLAHNEESTVQNCMIKNEQLIYERNIRLTDSGSRSREGSLLIRSTFSQHHGEYTSCTNSREQLMNTRADLEAGRDRFVAQLRRFGLI
jgi:hypothetical protein